MKYLVEIEIFSQSFIEIQNYNVKSEIFSGLIVAFAKNHVMIEIVQRSFFAIHKKSRHDGNVLMFKLCELEIPSQVANLVTIIHSD